MGKGLREYRLKHDPEELRFAEMWAKWSKYILPLLLSDGVDRVEVSERDAVVADTLIQWLGSPIGQGFLRDLGYTKG